mgnify:CR=1 FL=1
MISVCFGKSNKCAQSSTNQTLDFLASKLNSVINTILNQPRSQRKIIFCHYRQEINIIKSILTSQNIFTSVIDGRAKQKERESMTQRIIHYNDFKLEGFEHLHTTGKEQEQIVKENLEGWDNIYHMKGTFPINIKPGQPTVLFYDGDHSMNMVKQALDTYSGVKYIYVDDYNFPGTKQAVDEHILEHNKKLTLIDGIAFITDKEEYNGGKT